MARILLLLVAVFVVLLGIRLIGRSQLRHTSKSDEKKPPAQPEAMVQCGSCGVYLPKSEALASGDRFLCADPKCRQQR